MVKMSQRDLSNVIYHYCCGYSCRGGRIAWMVSRGKTRGSITHFALRVIRVTKSFVNIYPRWWFFRCWTEFSFRSKEGERKKERKKNGAFEWSKRKGEGERERDGRGKSGADGSRGSAARDKLMGGRHCAHTRLVQACGHIVTHRLSSHYKCEPPLYRTGDSRPK